MRVLLAIAFVCASFAAAARDNGQWEATDEQLREWYRNLMQPDYPRVSCCGEADAYWADSFEVGPNGETIAIVTDTRPDAPLERRHVPPGTKIVVPNNKLKFDKGNPTGHGVIFLALDEEGNNLIALCYVTPGGV